jgi:MFS family permease
MLVPSHAASPLAASPASPVRRVVWLVGLSHFSNHFVMWIFPAVLLLVQQEFNLGYFGVGLLANVALLCYGVGALPAGVLADRLGGERILAVWLLGGGVACIGIGLSSGPVGLAVGLAALGLFGSLHHPAGSGVLVALRNVAGLDVGRAFGLSGLLGNIGLAASPVVAATVAVRWGWRAAFLVGTIPGLLLVLFSIGLSVSHFSLGTVSNTFIAFHTPPHLGGTAFGITFTLALGVGSLASGAMGFVGQRFGLPAVFMVLGMVAVGATGMVFWFGHVVGAWPRKTVQAVTPPVPDSRSARH